MVKHYYVGQMWCIMVIANALVRLPEIAYTTQQTQPRLQKM